mmetsp:Transcript_35951/g.83642  ORF Transcript_35951/g.83642 Transcript_35951/m.83642 type:complete len:123 (+) Transcript_35951:92-460(+)
MGGRRTGSISCDTHEEQVPDDLLVIKMCSQNRPERLWPTAMRPVRGTRWTPARFGHQSGANSMVHHLSRWLHAAHGLHLLLRLLLEHAAEEDIGSLWPVTNAAPEAWTSAFFSVQEHAAEAR